MEEGGEEVHPSVNQKWYPDNFDLGDLMPGRIEKGYEFPYPKDSKIDGLSIERFNEIMRNFYKRRSKLDLLIMANIS